MAWTSVHTFAVGDALGAADLNTWLSNNTLFLFQPPSVRCTNSAAQAVANATDVAVAFDTERWKNTDAGMHSTSTNNSRFIAITAGVYVMIGHALTAAAAPQVRLRLNGTVGLYLTPNSGSSQNSATTFWKMAVNDYMEVVIIEVAGATTMTVTGNSTPEGGMAWISG